MKLIGTYASPYVRKVRVVLAEKDIHYEFAMGDVMSPESPIFETNPLGKIPCLLLPGGEALYDSKVIVEYLDSFPSGPALIPVDALPRARMRCWESLADGALDAGILTRWEAVQRAPQHRDPAWVERQMRKMNEALKAMSAGLADKEFCAGGAFTLADASVGCALGWFIFRFPEMDWQTQYPNLRSLFERLSMRSSFATTLPRAT